MSKGQFARSAARRKRCRNPECRAWFAPMNSMARACSPRCAIVVAQADAVKKQRAKDRQTKEQLKTASDYRKEAQAAFNAWVRERDHRLPCVSCGKPAGADSALTGGNWDCGHYRSTGANPELRFEPLNAHKQCKKCNQQLSGNVVDYRINLRIRIGDDALAWLEGSHASANWSRDDYRHIRDHYRAEARRVKREREQRGSVTA